MTGPLAGITVVALEQAVSAPLATRHLADLGARVIKVERPAGGDFARQYDAVVDGLSCHFAWLNRGKESIILDFKTVEGREVLERLLVRADVVVHNIAGEAAERAGLTPEQLVRRFPTMVACAVSGYGRTGSYAGRPAYDLTIQAETGSIAVTGRPGALAKPGVAIADIGAGMYAYSSVLAALYERRTTGKGRAIDIAMFDVLAEWMGYSLNFVRYSGEEQVPFGIGTQAICPYGAYDTRDGRQIVAGVQNEREWERLCRQVIDRPDLLSRADLANNEGRLAHREAVEATCAEGFAQLTFVEARARLDSARIANGLVRQVSEVLEHPQLVERQRYWDVPHAGGTVRSVRPVPETTGWAVEAGPIPALGEHTAAIRAELGYPPAHQRRMDAADVVSPMD